VDPPLQQEEGDAGRDDDDDRAGGDDLPLGAERSCEPEQRRRDEALTRQIEEWCIELVVDRNPLDDHDRRDGGLEQRNHDSPVHRPAVGAVDHRRFVERDGDRLHELDETGTAG
jgi:hypothetical protein